MPQALFLSSEAATAVLATRLASLTRQGDILALWGQLGAGKTVFARAFIEARAGVAIEVPSPTFTLVQVYEWEAIGCVTNNPADIFHFDLFRLEAAEDVFELGIEDAFASGISLIEWPDRLGPFLPADRLDLAFTDVPGETDARLVTLTGHGNWRLRLAEARV